MAVLFHPTHRKYIKLLRSYADRGAIINITDRDKEHIFNLFYQTNKAIERHKAIYKRLLVILNRNTPLEEGEPFTHEMVDIIENTFAHMEHRRPCNTFLAVAVLPLLQFLLRKLNNRKLT